MGTQILTFPRRKPQSRAAREPAHEPALVCGEPTLGQQFHYWRGLSGRRYLHTVFDLVECPQMPKATYVLVRRDRDGRRRPLAVGQTVDDAQSLNLAHLRHNGAKLGANEIHVHLLAETALERAAVAEDLRAGRFGRPRRTAGTAAA